MQAKVGRYFGGRHYRNWGIWQWDYVSENSSSANTNGRGESRENYFTTAYFDIEKGAWRSFRWETLIKVF